MNEDDICPVCDGDCTCNNTQQQPSTNADTPKGLVDTMDLDIEFHGQKVFVLSASIKNPTDENGDQLRPIGRPRKDGTRCYIPVVDSSKNRKNTINGRSSQNGRKNGNTSKDGKGTVLEESEVSLSDDSQNEDEVIKLGSKKGNSKIITRGGGKSHSKKSKPRPSDNGGSGITLDLSNLILRSDSSDWSDDLSDISDAGSGSDTDKENRILSRTGDETDTDSNPKDDKEVGYNDENEDEDDEEEEEGVRVGPFRVVVEDAELCASDIGSDEYLETDDEIVFTWSDDEGKEDDDIYQEKAVTYGWASDEDEDEDEQDEDGEDDEFGITLKEGETQVWSWSNSEQEARLEVTVEAIPCDPVQQNVNDSVIKTTSEQAANKIVILPPTPDSTPMSTPLMSTSNPIASTSNPTSSAITSTLNLNTSSPALMTSSNTASSAPTPAPAPLTPSLAIVPLPITVPSSIRTNTTTSTVTTNTTSTTNTTTTSTPPPPPLPFPNLNSVHLSSQYAALSAAFAYVHGKKPIPAIPPTSRRNRANSTVPNMLPAITVVNEIKPEVNAAAILAKQETEKRKRELELLIDSVGGNAKIKTTPHIQKTSDGTVKVRLVSS